MFGYLADEDYFSSAGSSSIGNGDGNDNESNQNEDGSIVGSVVEQSEVSGARVYYTDNYNIIETDENGSFQTHYMMGLKMFTICF